uniref:Transmembrane protein n=1 Tax=Panagrellus redivivus TaxID=6233 RepID=A0A7E4W6K5_PANRE
MQYLQLNITDVDNGFKVEMALLALPAFLGIIIATYCIAGRFICQVPLVPGQGPASSKVRQFRKLSADVAALDISMWDIEEDTEPHHHPANI